MNNLLSYDHVKFTNLNSIDPSIKRIVSTIDSWCLVEDYKLTFYGNFTTNIGSNEQIREIDVPDGVQDVKAGDYFYAFTTKNQDLYILGTFNSENQKQQYNVPYLLIHDSKIDRKIHLTTGCNHLVAVFSKGKGLATSAAFGANDKGQLGTGTIDPFNRLKVYTEPVFRAYAAGDCTFRFVKNGKLMGCGSNMHGQLGGLAKEVKNPKKYEIKVRGALSVYGTAYSSFFTLQNGDIYALGRIQHILSNPGRSNNPKKTVITGTIIDGGNDIVLIEDKDTKALQFWIDDEAQKLPIEITKNVLSASCRESSHPILILKPYSVNQREEVLLKLPENVDIDRISIVKGLGVLDFVSKDENGSIMLQESDIRVNVFLTSSTFKIVSVGDSNRYQIALALRPEQVREINLKNKKLVIKTISPGDGSEITMELKADSLVDALYQNILKTLGSDLVPSSFTHMIVPPAQWVVDKTLKQFKSGKIPFKKSSFIKHDERVMFSIFFKYFPGFFEAPDEQQPPKVLIYPFDEFSASLGFDNKVGSWQPTNDMFVKNMAMVGATLKFGKFLYFSTPKGLFMFNLSVRGIKIENRRIFDELLNAYGSWQVFIRRCLNLSGLRSTIYLDNVQSSASKPKIYPFEGVDPKLSLFSTRLKKSAWAGSSVDKFLIRPINEPAKSLAVKTPYVTNWYLPNKKFFSTLMTSVSKTFEQGVVTVIDKAGVEYTYIVGYLDKAKNVKTQTKELFDAEQKGLKVDEDPNKSVLIQPVESVQNKLLHISRLYLPASLSDAIHIELLKTLKVVEEYVQWLSYLAAYLKPPFTINGKEPDLLQRMVETGHTSVATLVRNLSRAELIPDIIGTLYTDEALSTAGNARSKMMEKINEKASQLYSEITFDLSRNPSIRVHKKKMARMNADIIAPIRLNKKIVYVDELANMYLFDHDELVSIMNSSDVPVNPSSGLVFLKAFVENYKEQSKDTTMPPPILEDDSISFANKVYLEFLKVTGNQKRKTDVTCDVCRIEIANDKTIVTECGGDAKKLCSLTCAEELKCPAQAQAPAVYDEWFPDDIDDIEDDE